MESSPAPYQIGSSPHEIIGAPQRAEAPQPVKRFMARAQTASHSTARLRCNSEAEISVGTESNHHVRQDIKAPRYPTRPGTRIRLHHHRFYY